jgi:bleomycin hydrolase
MTHAMVISGVHLDSNGSPVRYKVENSWGETSGDRGYVNLFVQALLLWLDDFCALLVAEMFRYFVMSDKWFEEFVYQVVVPKALAPKNLVKVFESDEKIVYPPWDPMVYYSFDLSVGVNCWQYTSGSVGMTEGNRF